MLDAEEFDALRVGDVLKVAVESGGMVQLSRTSTRIKLR